MIKTYYNVTYQGVVYERVLALSQKDALLAVKAKLEKGKQRYEAHDTTDHLGNTHRTIIDNMKGGE